MKHIEFEEIQSFWVIEDKIHRPKSEVKNTFTTFIWYLSARNRHFAISFIPRILAFPSLTFRLFPAQGFFVQIISCSVFIFVPMCRLCCLPLDTKPIIVPYFSFECSLMQMQCFLIDIRSNESNTVEDIVDVCEWSGIRRNESLFFSLS